MSQQQTMKTIGLNFLLEQNNIKLAVVALQQFLAAESYRTKEASLQKTRPKIKMAEN